MESRCWKLLGNISILAGLALVKWMNIDIVGWPAAAILGYYLFQVKICFDEPGSVTERSSGEKSVSCRPAADTAAVWQLRAAGRVLIVNKAEVLISVDRKCAAGSEHGRQAALGRLRSLQSSATSQTVNICQQHGDKTHFSQLPYSPGIHLSTKKTKKI